jgi:hypothetical protein
MQATIPVDRCTGSPAPDDRLEPCIDERDERFGIEPRGGVSQGLQVATWLYWVGVY